MIAMWLLCDYYMIAMRLLCDWEEALATVLQAGAWAAVHPGAPMPLLRAPLVEDPPLSMVDAAQRRKDSKHSGWVTERGPVLCGTFGCFLADNHSGLHKIPESQVSGRRGARSRRSEEVEEGEAVARPEVSTSEDRARQQPSGPPLVTSPSPAAAAASALYSLINNVPATPSAALEGVVAYSELTPTSRLGILHCLCCILCTTSETRQSLRGGAPPTWAAMESRSFPPNQHPPTHSTNQPTYVPAHPPARPPTHPTSKPPSQPT